MRFEVDALYNENVQNLEGFNKDRPANDGRIVQVIQLVPEDFVDEQAEIHDVESAYAIAKATLNRLITTYSVGPVVSRRDETSALSYWKLQVGKRQCYMAITQQSLVGGKAQLVRGDLPIQAVVSNSKPKDYDNLLTAQELRQQHGYPVSHEEFVQQLISLRANGNRLTDRRTRIGQWLALLFGREDNE